MRESTSDLESLVSYPLLQISGLECLVSSPLLYISGLECLVSSPLLYISGLECLVSSPLLYISGLECLVSSPLLHISGLECLVSSPLLHISGLECVVSSPLLYISGLECLVSSPLLQISGLECLVSSPLLQIFVDSLLNSFTTPGDQHVNICYGTFSSIIQWPAFCPYCLAKVLALNILCHVFHADRGVKQLELWLCCLSIPSLTCVLSNSVQWLCTVMERQSFQLLLQVVGRGDGLVLSPEGLQLGARQPCLCDLWHWPWLPAAEWVPSVWIQ